MSNEKLIKMYDKLDEIENELFDMYNKDHLPNEHIRDFIICAMEHIRKLTNNETLKIEINNCICSCGKYYIN